MFSGIPALLGVGVKEDLYSSSEILISRKTFLASADNQSYGVFRNFLTFLLVGVTSSTVSPKPCVCVCATPKPSSAFSTLCFPNVGALMCALVMLEGLMIPS